MPYEIEFTTESLTDLKILRATDRSKVIDAIETHLLNNPTQESKSRIKRLREMDKPQYRLRVDEIRIFYDVLEDVVEIIAIVPKSQAAEWLLREGKTTETTEE
ncbi:MAG: type II toxin-antitoxin system RelE/ParE family toxin [Oscillatoriales cyanobacterium RU_3_3]|nr:type II toxin-antitoxin system RelE/ParE family toxin [Microcoleus sp. SU_5_6]NJL68604.1 type II toxin-antitoxin system RelE/ParE family toxin [Microcoleus sp. SM1_3_4]NJM59656.1 type II toxin-antitoxin system RelE/ParE family toxin [Oscillatoriales cyanobacterium RU_3_3]NJR23846.1 type II toxin-antitoxin system RelE/ParE family toxin [Richelia sp. CSU_2_1]